MIRRFVDDARAKKRRVAVLAPTGLSAAVVRSLAFIYQLISQIGGQTIHSFGGFPINVHEYSGESLINRLKTRNIRNFQSTDAIVVDEASMCHPELLSKLDFLFRHFRSRPDKPFGGIQVILSGDFYQLPPVFAEESRSRKREFLELARGQHLSFEHQQILLSSPQARQFLFGNLRFLFDSYAWRELLSNGMHVSELNQVFRQEESDLIGMLNEIRVGNCSANVLEVLRRNRHVSFTDGIVVSLSFVVL